MPAFVKGIFSKSEKNGALACSLPSEQGKNTERKEGDNYPVGRPLMYETFRKAVEANPDAHPLFHSGRDFQYTNRKFHRMLEEHKMEYVPGSSLHG